MLDLSLGPNMLCGRLFDLLWDLTIGVEIQIRGICIGGYVLAINFLYGSVACCYDICYVLLIADR